MSFHQVQADMRVYVRRVYNAKLEGPPIPTGRGVWQVWIREPGATRPRMVKVSHSDLRAKTSNDPSRRSKRRTRRDPTADEVAESYYAGRRDAQAVMKPGAKLTDYGRGMRDAIKDMGGRF